MTSGRTGISHVGVVVPAHDEQELLPACLAALRVAVDRLSVARRHITVDVAVVLDRCTDHSADVVRQADSLGPGGWVRAVPCTAGSVGAARQVGVTATMRPDRQLHRVWLACTDADSEVPPGWLVEQVRFAESGAQAVVGTVTVDNWAEHPRHVQRLWSAGYSSGDGHPHVHGANLGVRASALAAVGGFPPVRLHEDVAVVRALVRRFGDSRVVRTGAIAVATSARRRARATGGFADFLDQLDSGVAS